MKTITSLYNSHMIKSYYIKPLCNIYSIVEDIDILAGSPEKTNEEEGTGVWHAPANEWTE